MKPKTYNTPKRKCVVKTPLTEDERKTFEDDMRRPLHEPV